MACARRTKPENNLTDTAALLFRGSRKRKLRRKRSIKEEDDVDDGNVAV